MRSSSFPRVLGLLTFGYGAYTLASPGSLLQAAGLEQRGPARTQSSTRAGRALGRLVGTRDLISGAALMLARPGVPLQAAVVARVACDTTDVVGFGLAVPPQSRVRVVAIAAGWGALCATAFPFAKRTR